MPWPRLISESYEKAAVAPRSAVQQKTTRLEKFATILASVFSQSSIREFNELISSVRPRLTPRISAASRRFGPRYGNTDSEAQANMDHWLEQFADASFRRSSDTAHDLKTPLNVAVLNLELLRMRMRKLADGDDEKVIGYARAIELELRRMARIFDTFFLLSVPPKGEGAPARVALGELAREAAESNGFTLASDVDGACVAHQSRIREAMRHFFEAAARYFSPEQRSAGVSCDDRFTITVEGRPLPEEFDITKVFKFYYTDPLGNPDLSLATARLIVEAYGGDVVAEEDGDRISLRLSLPGEP